MPYSLNDIVNLLRRRRWVTGTLVGLASALVIVWWVLTPRAQSAYQSFQTWQEQEERIQSAEEWESQLARLKEEQRRLEQRLDSLFVTLPQGDRMSVVLNVLQRHANRTGVTLRHVQPQARIRYETWEELPVDIALAGGYHSIAGFLDRIERSKYLLRVERIGLETEDMLSDTLQTQIRLNLVTLRERRPEASSVHLHVPEARTSEWGPILANRQPAIQ